MKLVISLGIGLVIALILGRWFGAIGWVMGLAAGFAIGTFWAGKV